MATENQWIGLYNEKWLTVICQIMPTHFIRYFCKCPIHSLLFFSHHSIYRVSNLIFNFWSWIRIPFEYYIKHNIICVTKLQKYMFF